MEDRIKESSHGYAEPVRGKAGTYRLYFSLGRKPDGKGYLRSRKKTYHCRSKNPKNWPTELRNALDAYREELEGFRSYDGRAWTVADYADEFHRMREGVMKSPLAYEREGYDVRHIRELFGTTSLRRLTPDDVRRAYAQARKSGRFSESEIRRIHTKLKQIMQEAVENELIDRNPCASVKLPKRSVEARKFLPPEELPRFSRCLREEEMSANSACAMLLFHCGLRKGEALGLSWEDYDSDARELHIVKQYTNDKTLRPPKSEASRRPLSVDETLASYLATWKTKQRSLLAAVGIVQNGRTPIVHALSYKVDEGGNKVPCAGRVEGHNFSRWFNNFCVDNGYGTYETVTSTFVRDGKKHVRGHGYKGLVPHGLRHTVATTLIAAGVDTKTVQARLGHASPSTTLAIYSHAIKSNDRKAADVFDKIAAS